jgi:hypothetical protein
MIQVDNLLPQENRSLLAGEVIENGKGWKAPGLRSKLALDGSAYFLTGFHQDYDVSLRIPDTCFKDLIKAFTITSAKENTFVFCRSIA